MPYIEDFHEFSERHGCECIYSSADKLYLFENGATSNGDMIHNDPPSTLEGLLKNLLRFHKLKLQWAEDAFDAIRNREKGSCETSEGWPLDFQWQEERLGIPKPRRTSHPDFYDEIWGDMIWEKVLSLLKDVVAKRKETVRRLQNAYNSLPRIKKKLDAERRHDRALRERDTHQYEADIAAHSVTL